MKTRRCVYFLSVLLIAVLVCGLVPSAWADNGCPNGVCNDGLGCPCGCGVKQTHERAYSDFPVYPAMDERYAAPVMDMASSPDMYDDYAVEPVAYVMEAEDDVMKDARAEALLNFMLYAEAAEAQSDPYVRRELYFEAQRILDEYLGMIQAETEAPAEAEPVQEEPVAEPVQEEPAAPAAMARDMTDARAEALLNFMLYAEAAEAQSDPYVRRELYLEAQRILDEYLGMILTETEVPAEPAAAPVPEDADTKDARAEAMLKFMLYAEAAEAQRNPYARYELYLEAQRVLDEYLDMVLTDAALQSDMYAEDPYMYEDPWMYAEDPYYYDDYLDDEYLPEFTPDDWDEARELMTDELVDAFVGSIEQYFAPAYAPEQDAAAEHPFFGLPNPWKETAWLEDAIAISGVDTALPEADALPEGMALTFFRAVPGTLEADYTDGAEELMIRASLDDEGYDLSGDYNVYSYEWEENIAGLKVDCLGDGEHINVASFKCGDVAYALTMACGEEGKGLTVNELEELIKGMQLVPEDVTFEAEDPYLAADENYDSAVITHSDVLLTTLDHAAEDDELACRAETNLGDFSADAYRVQGGTDIGIINGDGMVGEFGSGDITYEDVMNAYPYGDVLCVAEMSGQQLLNALEWACRMLPEGSGSFLQVSGLTFEIHSYLPSPCLMDMNGDFVAIMGERRVKNVMVGGEPLDPNKTYTVAAGDYVLNGGGGNTAFAQANILKMGEKTDAQLMVDYMIDDLKGVIGEEYADPNGQGRIVIVENAPEAEEAAAKESAAEEPDAEEPAVEEPASEEPAAESAGSPAGKNGGQRHSIKKGGFADKKNKGNAE